MSRRCLLAFSGGLDTTFCALYLQDQGWEVHTATVHCGGFSEEELNRIAAVAEQAGVASHRAVDARSELFERTLRYAIYGNVLRGNLYPLSVSAERVVQARVAVRVAREVGAQALAHGSTGAGNDQVRFDVAFRAIAPDLEIITPIRSLALSREEETAFLTKRGIQIPPKTTAYSINEGMWGTSIGGRETLTSHQSLPEAAWPGGPIDPNLAPQKLVISFEQGIPVALDGTKLDPVELIARLNTLAGGFGIGRAYHVGDTILGIKGRIGFEAGAATVLIQAHRELEKLVLSSKQSFWKDQLGNLYGSLLHEGHAFDPISRDLEAFLESSQRFVSGQVHLELRPHSALVTGVESPYSLMNPDVATYGESNRLWTGDEATGFAKLYGLQQTLIARAQGEQV